MLRSLSYHEELITTLKEPLEAASYLEVVIEEGEPKMLLKALINVIEAQDGLNQSERMKQSYEKLKQILEEKGEIEFYCLSALLSGVGVAVSGNC